jgi:hypothetical protein
VVLQGYPSVGDKYRIRVRNTVTSTEFVVMDKIRTVDLFGVGTWRTPDVNGYFNYLNTFDNMDNVLAWWPSSGEDLWQVRLEILRADASTDATVWHNVQLDNTPPAKDIHIDSGGDCKDFTVDGIVNGHFIAQDMHFGTFGLSTEPNTVAFPSNQPTTTTPATSPTANTPGDSWALSTATPVHMKPCGYVVRLDVSDLAIIGSVPGSHNSASTSVGFCLRVKG